MPQSSPPPKPMPSPVPEKTPPTSSTPPLGSTADAGTMNNLPAVSSLRGMVADMRGGKPLDDESLRALLRQHFGQRLDIQTKYAEGYEISGYTVMIAAPAETDKELIPALEYLNAPARSEFLAGKIARLRVMMARRTEGQDDMNLHVDTMMQLCQGYPADAIASATDEWMRTQKFFPTPKEFLDLLEEWVRLRRAILTALRGPKALPKPKPEPISWKDLPQTSWDAAMWDAYVAEAEGMRVLAAQNPTMMDVTGWEIEVEKRKAIRLKAFPSPSGAPDGQATGVAPPT